MKDAIKMIIAVLIALGIVAVAGYVLLSNDFFKGGDDDGDDDSDEVTSVFDMPYTDYVPIGSNPILGIQAGWGAGGNAINNADIWTDDIVGDEAWERGIVLLRYDPILASQIDNIVGVKFSFFNGEDVATAVSEGDDIELVIAMTNLYKDTYSMYVIQCSFFGIDDEGWTGTGFTFGDTYDKIIAEVLIDLNGAGDLFKFSITV